MEEEEEDTGRCRQEDQGGGSVNSEEMRLMRIDTLHFPHWSILCGGAVKSRYDGVPKWSVLHVLHQ